MRAWPIIFSGPMVRAGDQWSDNPEIYAICFAVHRCNINDILAAKEAA